MRVVSRFLLLISILAGTSQVFSYLYLQATAPRKPDVSLGAIYLRHMQGDTVYLTKAQSYYCNDEIINLLYFAGSLQFSTKCGHSKNEPKSKGKICGRIEEGSENVAKARL